MDGVQSETRQLESCDCFAAWRSPRPSGGLVLRTGGSVVVAGYICIAPKVWGSTGYGMEFQKANDQDLGGGDLQDEVYTTEFLLDTGYVDVKKIGITGGSYGGFMTLMAIGKTPEAWAARSKCTASSTGNTMLQLEDPSLQEQEKSLPGDPERQGSVGSDFADQVPPRRASAAAHFAGR